LRVTALLLAITAGLLGLVSGTLYVVFTLIFRETQMTGTSFIFQLPNPIYESSYWYLGIGAIFVSLLGTIAGVLSYFKPKVASIMLLSCAVLGLLVIFVGYLFNSLLFFAAGLVSLLEHRRRAYNLNLMNKIFPRQKKVEYVSSSSGKSSTDSSAAGTSPSKESGQESKKTGSESDEKENDSVAGQGGVSQETMSVGNFLDEAEEENEE